MASAQELIRAAERHLLPHRHRHRRQPELGTQRRAAAPAHRGRQQQDGAEGQPAQQVRLAPKTRREPGAPC